MQAQNPKLAWKTPSLSRKRHRITGWRRNQQLGGKPDFVFTDSKLALFVDGCFWHGCRKHLRMPVGNRSTGNA